MPNVDTPMNITYTPEMDVTEELDDNDVTYFQELIGVLRWATEIGRVDILLEVSLLSQYKASPREGHFGTGITDICISEEAPKTFYVHVSRVTTLRSLGRFCRDIS